ncbi:ATP-binding protein [Bosea sp. FBZP-16]|uniref:ATP-binding protein n=1 Tax=Bosea sp. FBZP-16 TaxID=2065382 RepID=UPI000C306BEB|nr:ATP-binding protein [Bosea sp. FBZP-16]
MAIALNTLRKQSGRGHPPVLSMYGTGGVGKTSLALEFPSPLYLYTDGEAPPDGVDFTPAPIESFADLMDPDEGYFSQLLSGEHDFKTVVVDSVDAFEPMLWAATCKRQGWDSIDSNDKGSPTAFGKGYLAADDEWRDVMAAAGAVARSGLYVIFILHSEAKTFNDPLVDSYDRYKPKLQKRAVDIVTEKSDALLFLNRRHTLKTVDGKGFGAKKETRPEGKSGEERLIYTDERAGFLAKNRMSMPGVITYKAGQGFAELSKHIKFDNDNNTARAAA